MKSATSNIDASSGAQKSRSFISDVVPPSAKKNEGGASKCVQPNDVPVVNEDLYLQEKKESCEHIVSTEIQTDSSKKISMEHIDKVGINGRDENSLANLLCSELHVINDNGVPYIVENWGVNPTAAIVNSKKGNRIIWRAVLKLNPKAMRSELKAIIEDMIAYAEDFAPKVTTYHRYAPLKDGQIGIEIFLNNPAQDRIRVTASGYEVLSEPSEIIFRQVSISEPLPYPANSKSVSVLKELLNLDDLEFMLLVAWLTYTMSLPKAPGSKYVFLVINGDQGTGKSFISRIIQKVVDPNALGIVSMPSKIEDLGLIIRDTHVACFDNNRTFSNKQSDKFCQISTGASEAKRQLYTDGDLHVTRLHGAVVLNGINDLITQSDLAQRCLTFNLNRIPDVDIKSEAQMLRIFDQAHAEIFAYLLNLMTEIYYQLPEVLVIRQERQIDFCKWLAALECVRRLPVGELQNAYSDNLKETQLDTLQGSTLASAVLSFAENIGNEGFWKGSPQQLLDKLEDACGFDTRYTRDFPSNPIAMSKRLKGLKASLLTQGIEVQFGRGKERHITIVNHSLG